MTNEGDEQRRRNLQSRDAWDSFANHRRRVTGLLAEQIERAGAAGNARVCVLGAGNCNDLDLARLTPLCAEIHLVDLDGDALVEGLARQSPPLADRVKLHGEIDLSQRLDPDRWVPAPFDVVASVCLLSQLLETVLATVAPDRPLDLPLVQAERLRHLQGIVEGLRPGGRGLLVTDIVSSVTCPTLANTPSESLPALLRQLVARHNFFTGLNPGVIERQLRAGPNLGERIDNVVTSPPWLWDLGPRVYAVCAWSFARRTAN